LKDLQETLDIICSGNFKKNDVLAFMMKLRQSDSLDPILVDLCHFFAHSQRDKGDSHGFIELFLQKFISACENNAGIVIPSPFFNKKEVIDKILVHLSKLRLSVSHSDFKNHSKKFIDYLLESINNVEYNVQNPKVKCCRIEYKNKDKQEAFFCFQLQNISQQAIIRRDGSGMTCISIFYEGDKKLKPFEVFMR